MTTTFEVHRTVVLEDRSLFGVTGTILRGMVRIGMAARLREAGTDFDARVHAVEYLEPESGSDEVPEPTLLFSYSRLEKLERWRGLDWEGGILELEW